MYQCVPDLRLIIYRYYTLHIVQLKSACLELGILLLLLTDVYFFQLSHSMVVPQHLLKWIWTGPIDKIGKFHSA